MSTNPDRAHADRAAALQLPATLALTALTAATAISLCRVFPDWDYLRSMLVVVLGTHVVAALLRYWRAHVVLAIPVLLLTIVQLIAMVYYRDTLNGPFPGSRTLELMRIDLRLVISQFPTAVAPVPSTGSYAIVAAVALAVCAVLSDTFAFRAMGRIEAIVPTGVVFIFTAALGTDRHRITVAALWVSAALLTVAVLRFRHTSDEAAWMGARRFGLLAALPAFVVTFGLTAMVAAAVAPRLPGAGEKALIDTRNRQGSVTEVLSPLVDIGATLRQRSNLELFTVRSSDGPHYWRAIGVSDFDGTLWQPTEEDLQVMGDRSGAVALPGAVTSQEIVVLGMGGPLVPAAYHPVSVSPDDVFFAAETQTLVLPDQSLQEGDRIAVLSMVPRPTDAQLRAATVSGAPSGSLDLPGGVPQSARDLALQVTANAASPFDKALALQNWFRAEFEYDVDVQYGNSNDAIDAFLRDRRGFCQQFAGTFAVMARAAGLPARVAVGYTPGDLRDDGLYHVFGRHAHSWAEVWFDGLGWVPFEPTPGRGSPDAVGYSGVEPAQAGSGTDGSPITTPTTVLPPNSIDPGAPTTIAGGGLPGDGGGPTTLPSGPGGVGGTTAGGSGSSTAGLVFLAVVAAVLLWMLITPRVVRALARRGHRSPRDRVIAAWQRAMGTMSIAGAPAIGGATPLEYVHVAEVATGVDHRTLRELAVQVTRAVYAPREVDESTASRCEILSAEIDAICRERVPTAVRVRALFDPRLMRRRLTG